MNLPIAKIGSLFTGIGGLDLGIESALRDDGFDVETTFQVEADPYCLSILAERWPHALRHDDVRTAGTGRAFDPPYVDVLHGGSPCTDISNLGDRAGLESERSGLWGEQRRLVSEIRPRVVVWENVSAARSPHRDGRTGRVDQEAALATVLGDISACGYDAVWFPLRASDVGAPHRRERVFVVGWLRDVADLGGERLEGAPSDGDVEGGGGSSQRAIDHRDGRGGVRGPEPRVGRGVHGLPAGLEPSQYDLCAHRWPSGQGQAQRPGEAHRIASRAPFVKPRLMALGNSVVPQCAYVVGRVVAWAIRRTWSIE